MISALATKLLFQRYYINIIPFSIYIYLPTALKFISRFSATEHNWKSNKPGKMVEAYRVSKWIKSTTKEQLTIL